MSTFITKLDATGSGPRVAVKDIIDVAGVPTTAGCKALARIAEPAAADAACLAGLRAADAQIVGKANLHELAMLPIGTNPWFGAPVNPLDPALIPGGSSSGSAVAVASGEADIALGSDTGGSVRVPAACCGISGLKTTHGRIPLDGVWPLAPSLDTIGPMATTIGGVIAGMQLLEPGFTPAASAALRVGRVRTSGHPDLESAVDSALRAAELDVVDLDWDGMENGSSCFTTVYFNEIWDSDRALFEADPDGIGPDLHAAVGLVAMFRPLADQIPAMVAAWRAEVDALFEQVDVLALPTLPILPPRLDSLSEATLIQTVIEITAHVALFNPAGVPATAQPVPIAGSRVPGSLQLVGARGSDEVLVSTAARVEAAVR